MPIDASMPWSRVRAAGVASPARIFWSNTAQATTSTSSARLRTPRRAALDDELPRVLLRRRQEIRRFANQLIIYRLVLTAFVPLPVSFEGTSPRERGGRCAWSRHLASNVETRRKSGGHSAVSCRRQTKLASTPAISLIPCTFRVSCHALCLCAESLAHAVG